MALHFVGGVWENGPVALRRSPAVWGERGPLAHSALSLVEVRLRLLCHHGVPGGPRPRENAGALSLMETASCALEGYRRRNAALERPVHVSLLRPPVLVVRLDEGLFHKGRVGMLAARHGLVAREFLPCRVADGPPL